MNAQSSFGILVTGDGTTFTRLPDGRWLKAPPGTVIWLDMPNQPPKREPPAANLVTGPAAAELEAELQSYRLTGGPRK